MLDVFLDTVLDTVWGYKNVDFVLRTENDNLLKLLKHKLFLRVQLNSCQVYNQTKTRPSLS